MKPGTIQPATASAGPPIRWIYRPMIAITALAITSCTFTVAADGSKSGTLDGNAVIPIARAVIVATK